MTNLKFVNNTKNVTTLEANNDNADITVKLPKTEGTLITKEEVSDNYKQIFKPDSESKYYVGNNETFKTVYDLITHLTKHEKISYNPGQKLYIVLTSDVTETTAVNIVLPEYNIEISGVNRNINWTLPGTPESNAYGSALGIRNTSVTMHTLTINVKNQNFFMVISGSANMYIASITFNIINGGLCNVVETARLYIRGTSAINITLDSELKYDRSVLFIDAGGQATIAQHSNVTYTIRNESTKKIVFFAARGSGHLTHVLGTNNLDNTVKVKGDLNTLYSVANGCTVIFKGDFSEVVKSRDFTVANIPLGVWTSDGCFIANGNPTAIA